MSKKSSNFLSELIDPSKKSARLLAPFNTNAGGPWFFLAKTTATSSNPKSKNVVLAFAHDGIKFVEIASTDKLVPEAVATELNKAYRYRWYDMKSYTVIPGIETFRFVWKDQRSASSDQKEKTVTFGFQLTEWEAIERLINRIMTDINEDKPRSRLEGYGPEKLNKSSPGSGNSSPNNSPSKPKRKGSGFLTELIDPKKKNFRVLSPLNTNEGGPWFFFAKTTVTSANKKSKNVILAFAHDGVKFVEVESTDKIEPVTVAIEFSKAKRYKWYDMKSYAVVPGVETFRFVWKDQSGGPGEKVKNITFAFQLLEWDQIEPLIMRIMTDIQQDKPRSRLETFGPNSLSDPVDDSSVSSSPASSPQKLRKKASSFIMELMDPKKKNERVLAPLHIFPDGPFFFIAKTAVTTTNKKIKPVLLAFAHDGIKFIDLESTDKIDMDSVIKALTHAYRYRWYDINTYAVVPGTESFRFSWRDRDNNPDNLKEKMITFGFQLHEYDEIDPLIDRIMADIKQDKILSRLEGFTGNPNDPPKAPLEDSHEDAPHPHLANFKLGAPPTRKSSNDLIKTDVPAEDSHSGTATGSSGGAGSRRGSEKRPRSPSGDHDGVHADHADSEASVASVDKPRRHSSRRNSDKRGSDKRADKRGSDKRHVSPFKVKTYARKESKPLELDPAPAVVEPTPAPVPVPEPAKPIEETANLPILVEDSDSDAPIVPENPIRAQPEPQPEVTGVAAIEVEPGQEEATPTPAPAPELIPEHQPAAAAASVAVEQAITSPIIERFPEREAPEAVAEIDDHHIDSDSDSKELEEVATTKEHFPVKEMPEAVAELDESSDSSSSPSSSDEKEEPHPEKPIEPEPEPQPQPESEPQPAPKVEEKPTPATPEPTAVVPAESQKPEQKPEEPAEKPAVLEPKPEPEAHKGPWFFRAKTALNALSEKKKDIIIGAAHDGVKFIEVESDTVDPNSKAAAFAAARLYRWVHITEFKALRTTSMFRFNWDDKINRGRVGFQTTQIEELDKVFLRLMQESKDGKLDTSIGDFGVDKFAKKAADSLPPRASTFHGQSPAMAALASLNYNETIKQAEQPKPSPSAAAESESPAKFWKSRDANQGRPLSGSFGSPQKDAVGKSNSSAGVMAVQRASSVLPTSRALEAFNRSESGPWFFFAKTTLTATNTRRQLVVLAIAHDGIKYTEAASPDEVDVDSVKLGLYQADLLKWSEISSCTVIPMVQTLKVTHDGTQYGFQSVDWRQIEETINRITEEIKQGIKTSTIAEYGDEIWGRQLQKNGVPVHQIAVPRDPAHSSTQLLMSFLKK